MGQGLDYAGVDVLGNHYLVGEDCFLIPDHFPDFIGGEIGQRTRPYKVYKLMRYEPELLKAHVIEVRDPNVIEAMSAELDKLDLFIDSALKNAFDKA